VRERAQERAQEESERERTDKKSNHHRLGGSHKSLSVSLESNHRKCVTRIESLHSCGYRDTTHGFPCNGK